ncbi:MAG TPA: hypothetical protein VFR08_04530, partial [Candidatus Angelobacter sp.]|nr:hypothetical protein [Candidatus Angelobacter sp.]
MTLLSVLHVSKDLLVPLGESALRSVAVAGIAALLLALLPSKRSVVRLRVWTGVLYVALAMPLLGLVLPHFNVAIPEAWLGLRAAHSAVVPVDSSAIVQKSLATPSVGDSEPHRAPARADKHQQRRGTQAVMENSNSRVVASTDRAVSTAKPQSSVAGWMSRVSWSGIALAIYFLGFSILLARLVMGIRGSRRLAASARDITPRYFPRKGEMEDSCTSAALDFVALQSQRAGLEVAPHLKESPALLVPATVG